MGAMDPLGVWELSVGSGLAMGLRLGACLGRWGGQGVIKVGQGGYGLIG